MNLRSKELAARKREMSRPQIGAEEQARRYAAFLLNRDGIPANPIDIYIVMQAVKIDGRSTKRAWSYHYKGQGYAFPHRAYVPAEPVHELAD